MENGETPGIPSAGGPSKDEKMWGMFCHLAMLVQFVGIPFGTIVGPLVVWLIKRNEMPFVEDQGKEAVNFQITATIAALCCIPFYFLCGVGIVMIVGVVIADLVLSIMAAVKANEGVAYRYPFALRLIK